MICVQYVFSTTQSTREDAFAVRTDVFIKGQNIPAHMEFDDDEHELLHVVAYETAKQNASALKGPLMASARLRLLDVHGNTILFSSLLGNGKNDTLEEEKQMVTLDGCGPLTLKVERVCVCEAYRRSHTGAALMNRIEQFARQFPQSLYECEGSELRVTRRSVPDTTRISRLKLSSQEQASGFYEKVGYKRTSGVFGEFIPQVWMEKELD